MINLKNIKKTFNSPHIISNKTERLKLFDSLNLKVNSGDFITISGDNGSGKTSLLRLIKGLLLPDDGKVIFDKDFSKNDVVLFSQNYRSFFLNLSVVENLNFFHAISPKFTKELFNSEINNLLMKFNLHSKKNNMVSSLSSGEIKKLIIIRGYLQKGELLLFDEITNSLDVESREIIIKDLANTKKTVIWISHESAEFKNKNIINLILKKGKLHCDK